LVTDLFFVAFSGTLWTVVWQSKIFIHLKASLFRPRVRSKGISGSSPSSSLFILMPHASMHAQTARGRSPRTALTPIPEEKECVCFGKPDCSQARTRQHRESSGAERAGGAAKRAAKGTADERELPARRSVKEWPAHREARGRLTLRASADPHAEGMHAVCRLRDGVLTLGTEQRDAAGEKTEVVVAEVPVEELAVGMQRGCANMFTIATVYKGKTFDEIYCFCADPARRAQWIAVFRRMGVAVADMRD